ARFSSRSLIPVLFNSASFGDRQFRGHFYPGQMGTLSSGRNNFPAHHIVNGRWVNGSSVLHSHRLHAM
ncbi:MAG: hypothetical protein ABSG32_29880, partial [Terriglobia bacterium]